MPMKKLEHQIHNGLNGSYWNIKASTPKIHKIRITIKKTKTSKRLPVVNNEIKVEDINIDALVKDWEFISQLNSITIDGLPLFEQSDEEFDITQFLNMDYFNNGI